MRLIASVLGVLFRGGSVYSKHGAVGVDLFTVFCGEQVPTAAYNCTRLETFSPD
jgi:hypothetical protein